MRTAAGRDANLDELTRGLEYMMKTCSWIKLRIDETLRGEVRYFRLYEICTTEALLESIKGLITLEAKQSSTL